MKECLYTPQVFPGSLMPSVMPTITAINYVRFTYPFINPTLTIQCKPPELGNTETLTNNTIIRQTRGNTLHVFRPTSWPKNSTLSISFIGLSESEKILFENLLILSVGKFIGYLDYFSKQRKCLIINPDTEIIQERRDCGYSLQLQLENFSI